MSNAFGPLKSSVDQNHQLEPLSLIVFGAVGHFSEIRKIIAHPFSQDLAFSLSLPLSLLSVLPFSRSLLCSLVLSFLSFLSGKYTDEHLVYSTVFQKSIGCSVASFDV